MLTTRNAPSCATANKPQQPPPDTALVQQRPDLVPDEASVHLRAANFHARKIVEGLEQAIPGIQLYEKYRAQYDAIPACAPESSRQAKAIAAAIFFGIPRQFGCFIRGPLWALCEAGVTSYQLLRAATAGDERVRAAGLLGTGRSAGELDNFEWKSTKPTFYVDSYPSHQIPFGGEENLFGHNGACARYDQAFGTRSRKWQLKHQTKPWYKFWGDAFYAGFCDRAAEVACVLHEPKYPVKVGAVQFTPEDIKGLLVIVADEMVATRGYVGERSWVPPILHFLSPCLSGETGVEDPLPHQIHDLVFKQWGVAAGTPFVFEIDPTSRVFNYAYDSGTVKQLKDPPGRFNPLLVPKGGEVKFYEAEVKSTGFKEQNRRLRYWIHTAENGEETSGWIHDRKSTPNPDFAWRPLGEKEVWYAHNGRDRIVNPEIDPEVVHWLYLKSIGRDPGELPRQQRQPRERGATEPPKGSRPLAGAAVPPPAVAAPAPAPEPAPEPAPPAD